MVPISGRWALPKCGQWAAVANVQHTPRMMRILFRVTLEDKFRLAVELSADERWI